jgi:hypothetical protein
MKPELKEFLEQGQNNKDLQIFKKFLQDNFPQYPQTWLDYFVQNGKLNFTYTIEINPNDINVIRQRFDMAFKK